MDNSIYATQTGECVSILDVPDEVFSERILGDGVAIIPTENEVFSPVDGEIIQVAKTGHAFCITSNDGIDIMIHIGVDTVSLNGECFECFVKTGDKVKKGDKIASADIQEIAKRGFSIHTAIVITNCNILQSIKPIYGKVLAGQNIIMEYIKKS